MVEKLGFENTQAEHIFTEDVKKSGSFMKAFKALVSHYFQFDSFYAQYRSQGLRFRKQSKLKEALDNVEKAKNSLAKSLRELSGVKINAAVGLDVLEANVKQKRSMVTVCTLKIAKLLKLVSDKKLLQDLRGQVSQLGEIVDKELTDDDLKNVESECWNDHSLTWSSAFENIIEKQNSAVEVNGPLNILDLISVGTLIEDSTAIPFEHLFTIYPISKAQKNQLMDEILLHFPVVYVNIGRKMLVNIWQVDFASADFEQYAKPQKEKADNAPMENGGKRKEKERKEEKVRRKPGRKALVERFPTLIAAATEYVCLHGYSAHARRRETAATGTGCTLEELRDHLLKVVPGLKDAGCSRTALAYMFCLPHKGRKGAARYKSYIHDRVPCK